MHYFSADYVYLNGRFEENRVIICDAEGTILEVVHVQDIRDKTIINKQSGALIPGLVNTHCHLELSHMKGLVDTGTGLLPFLKKVVQFRDFQQEIIDRAIKDADREMAENGIVACGDISNKTDTCPTKDVSPIAYYTFVEMFDFMQETMTPGVIQQYEAVYEGQSGRARNRKSRVPHAPYTVSPALFTYIASNAGTDETVSIHNQEVAAENELFITGTGGFVDFYTDFGFDLKSFKPTGKSAIHRVFEFLDPNIRTLLVHNTQTSAEDVAAAQKWSDRVYFATCPNANLYIENRLPDYRNFMKEGVKMTIGTDSLTSNWQLNILEEIAAIKKYASYVPMETLIHWATLSGAEALGFDDWAGDFSTGKVPGINAVDIEKSGNDYRLNSTKVKKLI